MGEVDPEGRWLVSTRFDGDRKYEVRTPISLADPDQATMAYWVGREACALESGGFIRHVYPLHVRYTHPVTKEPSDGMEMTEYKLWKLTGGKEGSVCLLPHWGEEGC